MAFSLITTNGRFHEKGQKDAYADGTLVIVYYSPVWTDKGREISANLVLSSRNLRLQPGDPSSRQNDVNVDREAEPDAGVETCLFCTRNCDRESREGEVTSLKSAPFLSNLHQAR